MVSNAQAKRPAPLFLNSIGVEVIIERGDIDTAVGDGEAAPVIPAFDFVAAGPEFFAGLGIEDVQDGVGGSGDAAGRDVVETDIGVGLIGVFAVAVGEYEAVGDHGGLRAVHVAGDPGGDERRLAAFIFHFEGDDGAVFDGAVFDGGFELRVLLAPDRSEHPASAFPVFPTR